MAAILKEQASALSLLATLLGDDPDLTVLNDRVRWPIIKANSSRHGVAQLVASLARPHLSGPERAWCDQILTRSWTRHTENLAHVDEAIGVLHASGIVSVVLKGALQARRHYSPPFLRKPSGDVDLAVCRKDLAGACLAFENQGYKCTFSIDEATRRSHHIELTHPSRPHLELHFRLSHGAYGVEVDEFLGRAVPQDIPGGCQAMVLCPSDELFHLVLHRSHGRFATLFHLLEIRRIWRNASPEIRKQATALAVRHHFAGAFRLNALAFERHWNETFLLPGELPRTWLDWRITPGLLENFELLSDPGRTLPLTVRLRRRWLDFQLTDTPEDALRFLKVMARVAGYQLLSRGWKTVVVQR